jgi:L-glutamine:2-deoxy-scyllo-inosose/3-amino-2,3-dideoxy-scyllo-inosose aminotransferase
VSKLALLGGEPVTASLLDSSALCRKADLERKYLLEAYDSGNWDGWLAQGSQAIAFEEEFAEFNLSRYCLLVTNGTHALQLALEALDIGFGDEVIVPGLTWQATAAVACDVNAVPVLVDVDPDTLCVDPAKVEEAITPRTRAIMPVHLYNRMADIDRLRDIAQRHGLHVIEDCSHTHGSRWRERGAGTFFDFGTYSFQSTKLMNSAEGGAILTQSEELYGKLISQRACGREMKKGCRVHSGNYRMTSLQAGILRGQLEALRKNADIIHQSGLELDKAVEAAPGVNVLRRDRSVTRQCGYAFVFAYDPQRYDGMDCGIFRKALSAELGVEFGSTYEPLNCSPYYFPHTKRRHQIGGGYTDAINPKQWLLPCAEEAYRNRAVAAGWRLFGCDRRRVHLLTDAIAKIYEHRSELREYSNEETARGNEHQFMPFGIPSPADGR